MLIINKKYKGVLSRDINDYPEGIVVVVDKPYRWTSADVIRKVKFAAIRHFAKKNLKVGHAGTLDPLATGVLVVCIGNACKQAEAIQAGEKAYLADVCFGASTASYDLEKEVDAFFPTDGVSEESVKAVLPNFLGEQDQVAPLFSAKQVDGRRAYDYARKLYAQGKALDEAAAELLTVNHIDITGMTMVGFGSSTGLYGKAGTGSQMAEGASSRINVSEIPADLPVATILVECSKGTYIRSIARDLGESLGSGAFLSGLRRTRSGHFNASDALPVDSVLDILNKAQ